MRRSAIRRGQSSRRRLRLLVGALSLLAACGGSGDSEPTTTGRPGTTVSPATTNGPTTVVAPGTTRADEGPAPGQSGIDPLTGASTRTVTGTSTHQATALLTAVRAARHEGYDRVVFEFTGGLPSYEIGYISRPVTADGSGEEVTVAGAQVLGARFENALDADLTKESAPRTYTGPNRFRPATPQVVELVRTGGFEGVVNWAVGVNDRVDFRVTTLQSPPRVVVDLRNH